MADKYGVGEDAYCYPGSTVLRNKLDIRDEPTLSGAEQQLSAIAADNVEFSPPPYSLAYLQNIHRILFSDLFEWAGELRTVGMSKQATRFCQPEYMEKEASKVFTTIAAANWFEKVIRVRAEQLVVTAQAQPKPDSPAENVPFDGGVCEAFQICAGGEQFTSRHTLRRPADSSARSTV
ncbi:Fic family protein [Pseudomonas sp. Q11]|uniref:Fic/DOC family protein n=1 Tax=Pseudomonas sp. Q11 TaxID=2968470 RepID=UPI00210D0F66|nr:Fic family protein [Pseudomonas sp. Q11]MCQ6256948.1 Fic family protein [Pseudomonas sp. Q11]